VSSRVVPDDAKAVMRCETTEPGAAEKVGGCCSSCRGVEFDIDASLLPATLWQFSTRLGDIDVLQDAPGAVPFDELRARARPRAGDP
jgi:hypothetical protein